MIVKSFQLRGKRPYQQDAYYIDEYNCIFIVCDGVGGSTDGAKASSLVCKEIAEFYETFKKEDISATISESIIHAQNQINIAAYESSDFGNSGTTIAMMHICDNIATIAHLGDSKVIFIKGQCGDLWSTKDHSTVQELLEAGIIKNEEDTYTHPLKNRITNGIFPNRTYSHSDIPVTELHNISPGDIFIICTDGVFETYTPRQLQEILQSNTFDEALDYIQTNVDQHSRDNCTLIAILVQN